MRGANVTCHYSGPGKHIMCIWQPTTHHYRRQHHHNADDPTRSCFSSLQISLEFQEKDGWTPGPEEVVIDVHCQSLNLRDAFVATNLIPEASLEGSCQGQNVGLEASGTVTAVGPGVTEFKAGDRVLIPLGGYNRLILPVKQVLKVPDNVSMEVSHIRLK